MAWNPLRFRSAQRDFATDSERFSRVRIDVLDAIGQAERELDGLRRRIDAAREGAAFLYGNGTESQTTGTATQDGDLRQMEITLTRGQERASHLQAQLQELRTIARSLDELLRLDTALQKAQPVAS